MQQTDLIFNGKKYISARRASEITGYSIDYIGQLARGNKVASEMVGRNRFVEESGLLEYQLLTRENVKSQNKSKSEVMSVGVVTDLSAHQVPVSPPTTVSSVISQNVSEIEDVKTSSTRDEGFYTSNKEVVSKTKQPTALVATLAILVVILVGAFLNIGLGNDGLSKFVTSAQNGDKGSTSTEASVSKAETLEALQEVDSVFLGFLHSIDETMVRTAVNVRDWFLKLFEDEPTVIYVDNSSVDNDDESSRTDVAINFDLDDQKLKQLVREIMLQERNVFAPGGPYGGLVTLPTTGTPEGDARLIARIEESFSDEVIVQLNDSGTSGRIIPVLFKDQREIQDSYLFTIVPVNQ